MKKKITLIAAAFMLASSGSLFAQLTPEVLYYKFDGTGTSVPNLASAPPPGTATATIMGGVTQGGSNICHGTLIGSGVASSTDYMNTGWAPNLGTGSWTINFRTSNITPSSTLFYIFGDVNTSSLRCFTNGVAGANNWILRGAGLTDTYINGGATVAPHMMTFVYDNVANNVKGYLDGVLVTTVAQTAPNLTGTGPFKVGGYATNVGLPASGYMDEYRIYSRALTPSEITQLYNPFVPSGFLGSDVALCGGDSTELSIGWPYSAAVWSNGATSDSIYAHSPGTYTLAITGTCGSGNDTVNITSNSSASSITASNCGPYTAPSGATLSTSGTYMDTIPNHLACDSVITINLTVTNPSSSSFSVLSCGGTYTAPSGAIYTTSGIVMDTIPNSAGCDSVMTINLTVSTPTTSSFSTTSCGMYTAPSGAMYMSSGTIMDTIPNMGGCDSVITINLTVAAPTSSSFSVSACDMYTAPSGATYMTSGTIMDTIPNMAGCDSVMTINVTVNSTSSSTITVTSCDSYTTPSGSQTVTASGTYTDIIPNSTGCDSTITINLTINQSSSSSITASACGSYTAPSGAVFTTSGTHTDIIPNSTGCDSVITINLTINTVNAGITQNGAVFTASATGATYQWINCSNNAPIAGATSQSYTATANGSYAVIVTQNNCTDTSVCMSVTNIGFAENNFGGAISMYPNPSQGNFTIDLGAAYQDVAVQITDITGRIVFAHTSDNANLIPVELNAPAGMYMITVTAAGNKAVLKMIKE